MSLELLVIVSMFAGALCGLVLGFVIWGLDDTKEREIPEADDYRWED